MVEGCRSKGSENNGADSVATIGTSATMGAVNWTMVASASVVAGILSILTSVAGLPEVKE